MLCDDLLESVDIKWNKCYSIEKLSEGEKQLILSVGLSLVLNEKNILFLLDEPDNSLHPKWQQEFVSLFKQGLNDDSMAVITTHSPILVGNLEKEHVQIIEKGKIIDINSLYSFGRDVNSILGDYFKIQERNNEGKELIDKFYKAMTLKKYEDAESYLKKIEAWFGPSDLTTVKANSLYDDLAE